MPYTFHKSMAYLRKLGYLAIIGDFDLVNHESVEGLQCHLKELVLARGWTPSCRDLLSYLRRFDGTLRRVRIPFAEDDDDAELPAVQAWCAEKGIVLELVEEAGLDFLGGNHYLEEQEEAHVDLEGEEETGWNDQVKELRADLERQEKEPVWEFTEDELGNAGSERDDGAGEGDSTCDEEEVAPDSE